MEENTLVSSLKIKQVQCNESDLECGLLVGYTFL
jgi:hypothetical protein